MPLKVNPTTCQLDMVMGPGSGTAVVSVMVDDSTPPGTNPVVPTGAGLLTVEGAVVAAQSIPVETHSRAANTFNVEVQVGSAVTGAPGNKDAAGLVQFDDTQFSVDADGYVTSISGGFAWTDISGAFSPLAQNGYFITGTATGTLPASPSQGDTIQFCVVHASQVLTIQAAGTQVIQLGNTATSGGGTCVSTQKGDSLEIVYRAADDTWWSTDSTGSWDLT